LTYYQPKRNYFRRHSLDNRQTCEYCWNVYCIQTYSVGSRRSANFPTGCRRSARGEISPEITCTRSAATRATSYDDIRAITAASATMMMMILWVAAVRWSPSDVCTLSTTIGPERIRPSSLWP